MLWRRKIKNKILCYELGFEMYLLHGIKKKKCPGCTSSKTDLFLDVNLASFAHIYICTHTYMYINKYAYINMYIGKANACISVTQNSNCIVWVYLFWLDIIRFCLSSGKFGPGWRFGPRIVISVRYIMIWHLFSVLPHIRKVLRLYYIWEILISS